MTPEVSGQERVTPWRKRWARILLLGGLAVAIVPMLRKLPREQVFVFKPHAAIDQLRATWTPEGETDAAGGVTLNFAPPTREVIHHVSLPNGRYTLAISVDRTHSEARATSPEANPGADGAEPVDTTVIRQVTLTGGETFIGL